MILDMRWAVKKGYYVNVGGILLFNELPSSH
jgi:hypothetical protein